MNDRNCSVELSIKQVAKRCDLQAAKQCGQSGSEAVLPVLQEGGTRQKIDVPTIVSADPVKSDGSIGSHHGLTYLPDSCCLVCALGSVFKHCLGVLVRGLSDCRILRQLILARRVVLENGFQVLHHSSFLRRDHVRGNVIDYRGLKNLVHAILDDVLISCGELPRQLDSLRRKLSGEVNARKFHRELLRGPAVDVDLKLSRSVVDEKSADVIDILGRNLQCACCPLL